MLRDFKPRLYQETIFATAAKKNTLVVLPTGLGKTAIALLLSVHRLQKYPSSKILILAPTKPLAEQLKSVFIKNTIIDNTILVTGSISPSKRKTIYDNARIIVATPQTIENDMLSNNFDFSKISLIVFDEAHRAIGDYAYTSIAKEYIEKSKFPRILALTASPGSELEKINEIIHNLSIEEIEVRTDTDPDVRPYIKETNVNWVKVNFPDEFKIIHKYLKQFMKEKLEILAQQGYVHSKAIKDYNKRDLLSLQAKLRSEMLNNKDYEAMKAISITAELMKIEHAIELLETQGIHSLSIYLDKLEREGYSSKTKASQNIVKDINFRSAYIKTRSLADKNITHPKLEKLKEIVQNKVNSKENIKIIVFNQYRDNAKTIVDELNKLPNVKSRLFVGQAKKNGSGLSQKEQISMINDFRENQFNVLVSSSVGEEGLDIPSVDLVIFYEPIPSAIRHIQRRGRTARQSEGYVTILMTKGTRDEAYKWISFHKEKRMYRNLESLRSKISLIKTERDISKNKSITLDNFINNTKEQKQSIKPTIIIDHRETRNPLVKELKSLNIELRFEQLISGDYILSNRVGVEFKTSKDFVDSLIDKRILEQAKQLKQTYSRPIIIVEGEEDIYSIRNIHPNAIIGLLASLTIGYSIPVLFTKTSKETAQLLYTIAKREQEELGTKITYIGMKKPQTINEQQELILSSFPGIGPVLAKPLLSHFGSLINVFNATTEELSKVNLIGKKKAEKIKRVLEEQYNNR